MQDIQTGTPESQTIDYLSDFFRVFGDSTRLKIIYFLSRHEFCVADLSSLVGMQQSAVSHQLKILRLHRLVKFRKEGTTTYYSLDDKHVQEVFGIALNHVAEGMH
jgi:ArsR family transcriptional regulator, lead/cadmium/zinc/bismuth-responsive transcriptional repressor